MTLETYLAYLATVAVFFATPPGTSQILMISVSLRHGLRRSLPTIAGDLSANVLQMLAAAFGLAAIISTWASALTIIKWLGVAYLLWFGIRIFMARPEPLDRETGQDTASRRQFWRAFATSGANPEAVFFFAALFPQFLTPGAALAPQLAILGGTYLLFDAVILVAMGAGAERLLGGLRHRARLLNRIAGGMMIAAAALLGAKDVNAR